MAKQHLVVDDDANTDFSLVALCVSYNYFDVLQFMLPVNHKYFQQIYLITGKDDKDTIDFCKTFSNVTVLFYDFKNNKKVFDKNGAIYYGQTIMYQNYPESWYLILDSDIILPRNFLTYLRNIQLNEYCIYGAQRNITKKASDVLKVQRNRLALHECIDKDFNNLFKMGKWHPPTIIGWFQLYKKQVYYTFKDLPNAAVGDYLFCHKNFSLFCQLKHLVCLHLGPSERNWDGKVESFDNDIALQVKDIYYHCEIHALPLLKYYNASRELVTPEEFIKVELYLSNTGNAVIKQPFVNKSYKWEYPWLLHFHGSSNEGLRKIGVHSGTYTYLDNYTLEVIIREQKYIVEFDSTYAHLKAFALKTGEIVHGFCKEGGIKKKEVPSPVVVRQPSPVVVRQPSQVVRQPSQVVRQPAPTVRRVKPTFTMMRYKGLLNT